MVESTGELHHYYIKNKNGLYIDNCPIGGTTSCNGASASTAVVFKANYLNDGRIYFSTKDEGGYLTLDSNYDVVCTAELVEKSMWTIVRLEANNTGVEEVFGEVKDENIYDLNGRKVENPSSGLYIINGKKVFIKAGK